MFSSLGIRDIMTNKHWSLIIAFFEDSRCCHHMDLSRLISHYLIILFLYILEHDLFFLLLSLIVLWIKALKYFISNSIVIRNGMANDHWQTIHAQFLSTYIVFPKLNFLTASNIHSWQKRLLHPGMMCLFCDYFYFISPRGLRTGCLV